LRTESRENRDLGGGSPLVRGSAQSAIRFDFVKLSGCRGLLRMYFPRNWEFGSALPKLRNFGGGLNTPNPPSPLGTPLSRIFFRRGKPRSITYSECVCIPSYPACNALTIFLSVTWLALNSLDHEVHKGHWWHWKKKNFESSDDGNSSESCQ
jgi:hypothetical protein